MLSRSWRDSPTGLELELWLARASGPIRVVLTRQRAVLFVPRDQPTESGQRREVQLRCLSGSPVDAVYFDQQAALVRERQRLLARGAQVFEGDVKPVERFLMERFITGGAKVSGASRVQRGVRTFFEPKVSSAAVVAELRLLSIDIETDGFDGDLLCIAAVGESDKWCGMVGRGPARSGLWYFEEPALLLRAFFDYVRLRDPDAIVGWNLVEFDLSYLQSACQRLGVPFRIGRAGGECRVLAPSSRAQPHVARIEGRVALDGITTLRNASVALESYSLQSVAQRFLGQGKAIEATGNPLEEIRRMYREDKLALAEYNEVDCRLVLDLFLRGGLLSLALARQQLTGLPLERVGGAVAAFDHAYLPRLHRAGRVAPSVGGGASGSPSPGGHILESRPGLYENVLVLDFKSLYPSIMVTFCIDPYGLETAGPDAIHGFEGARFARQGHILPELVRALGRAREQAKREGNAALSQAIKISMNSVYGVLGTPACRFFDPRLVSSITRRGHEILQRSRDHLESQGLSVIYGDTDSLFVHLQGPRTEASCREQGNQLARMLNDYWRRVLREEHDLPSYLELQFETHYLRFLMPTMRSSQRGSKKRYAGSTRAPDGSIVVTFKGLEAVRTDWTRAARDFQRELYRRVFSDEPYVDYVRRVVRALFAGELDAQLVYRKRLRRELTAYEKNVPPHVQAARKLPRVGKEIQYVISRRGPEPAEARTAPLDYAHYFERQFAPAADSLLACLGTDLQSLAGHQPRLL